MDIDWYAVNTVCNERIPMRHLRPAEKRMVVRRLAEKMTTRTVTSEGRLTADDVAQLLGTTTRSVERFKTQLRHADKRICPVCREPMWVVNGEVEPHPDRLMRECPMSYSQVQRGLAAIRPDLYRWAEVPA